jgi:RNA polymerase sigma-70 factor (ECF subfamily)
VVSPDPDNELVARLRAGDEQAFVALVRSHHDSMIKVASSLVPSAAVAEEVVQETWLAVLRGIGGFQERSSLRTWVFRILVNRARTAGEKERRSVAVADPGPAVDAARFDASGSWAAPPEQWLEDAEDRAQAGKIADRIRSAIDDLPGRQRQVVTLRDIEGMTSGEVRGVLDISEINQRVLLHRGRSRVRQVIENEFGRSR